MARGNCIAGLKETQKLNFLLDGTSGTVPVEVKSGRNTRSRSLSVFRKRYDPGVSIKLGAWNFSEGDGVLHLPLYAAYKIPKLIR